MSVSVMGVRLKAPEDRRDADISFEEWLHEGDTLTEVEASSSDDALTVESATIYDDVVKVWISGGEAGHSYTVTVQVTTDGGRIKEVCFRIRVLNCR